MPATGYFWFNSRTAGFMPKGQCADDKGTMLMDSIGRVELSW